MGILTIDELTDQWLSISPYQIILSMTYQLWSYIDKIHREDIDHRKQKESH